MKQLEILANEMVADKLNKELEVVPMTGEKNQRKPKNGAHVLVHSWEPEVADGEEGFDAWEVMRWYEAGTVVDIGVDASEAQGSDKFIRELCGKKKTQEITRDGFYWQEDADEGPNRWHRIDDENVDCWCELTGTGKGNVIKKLNKLDELLSLRHCAEGEDDDEVEMPEEMPEEEKEIPDDVGVELMFAHTFRLFNNTTVTIETIPSSAWKDGKKLPADVGAFAWYWRNKYDFLIKKGELSARFEMPKEGHDWDTVSLAEQVLRYVLKNNMKISNPDGAYALVR